MNLSISTWNYICSYSDKAGLAAAIDEIKIDGFGLELWLGWTPDLQVFERGKWNALKKLTTGVSAISMHTALFGERGYDFDELKKEIDLGQYLRAKILVVHPDTLNIAEPKRDKNNYKQVREMMEYANVAGVTLALESMVLESGSMKILRQAVDSCGIKVCIDVGHANCDSGNSPMAFLEEFAAEVAHVHFADNDGSSDQHLVPGEGNIAWDQILTGLKELNFSGQCVLELNTGDARQSAHQAREYLKTKT